MVVTRLLDHILTEKLVVHLLRRLRRSLVVIVGAMLHPLLTTGVNVSNVMIMITMKNVILMSKT